MNGVESSAGIIFLSTVFANNLVLEWQLALCPFLATSQRMSLAIRMAAVSIIMMTVLSILSYLVYSQILIPLGATHLSLLILLLMLVVILQSLHALIRSRWPLLDQKYGVFLPLLTLNCAVIGLVLLMLESINSFSSALVFGFGSACGFGLLLIIFAGLNERLALADAPKVFKGAPLLLISLGILSMAFHGF